MAYLYFMKFKQLLNFKANIGGNCTFFFSKALSCSDVQCKAVTARICTRSGSLTMD